MNRALDFYKRVSHRYRSPSERGTTGSFVYRLTALRAAIHLRNHTVNTFIHNRIEISLDAALQTIIVPEVRRHLTRLEERVVERTLATRERATLLARRIENVESQVLRREARTAAQPYAPRSAATFAPVMTSTTPEYRYTTLVLPRTAFVQTIGGTVRHTDFASSVLRRELLSTVAVVARAVPAGVPASPQAKAASTGAVPSTRIHFAAAQVPPVAPAAKTFVAHTLHSLRQVHVSLTALEHRATFLRSRTERHLAPMQPRVIPGAATTLATFARTERTIRQTVPSHAYVFARSAPSPTAEMTRVTRHVEERTVVETVRKEVKTAMASAIASAKITRPDMTVIADEVQSILGRRLRLEKERLGLRSW